MSEWTRWHEAYDVPGSALAVRLGIVIRRVAEALDGRAPGPVRLVSMCAGQGRDVAGALDGHPRRADVTGRLVELDADNAAVARDLLAGTALEVVRGDAGDSAAYAGAVPADVVLVCGVFGNITDDDIRATIAALPELCAAGARVIWTRHRRAPDVTAGIRRWFAEAGFREVAFDSPGELEIGVGVHELAVPPRPHTGPRRLFTFVPRAPRG
ncbi:SAM-dependent methyltransferase [Dactylosporangium sp. NPDC000244]|uniref:SAM-dependent methyltransferase n=1 Tax=Dactylosporangium sp. NPDC000244 TaxID=3154365 RepID=UPI003322E421